MARRAPQIWPIATLWLCVVLLFSLTAENSEGADTTTPVGIWLHANKRIQVEIYPCDNLLCGKIVWFKWPNDAEGLPLVDLKNKNPDLRSRPLLGLTVLRSLRHSGDNSWTGGRIYNADDGEDYRAQVSIQDDGTLRLRAHVLFPAFGATQIWTRVK